MLDYHLGLRGTYPTVAPPQDTEHFQRLRACRDHEIQTGVCTPMLKNRGNGRISRQLDEALARDMHFLAAAERHGDWFTLSDLAVETGVEAYAHCGSMANRLVREGFLQRREDKYGVEFRWIEQ